MISFGQVAAHYQAMANGGLHEQLEEVVVAVTGRAVVRAKSYIGNQQDSWAPLAPATIEGFRHELGFWIKGKRELGFAGPDYEPLHRSGQLEDSISGVTEGLTGVVGSPDQVALYQEMGTHNARYPIPPRPFLALAMMHSTPDALELCNEVAAKVMIPGE